jgi:hypothetical protein
LDPVKIIFKKLGFSHSTGLEKIKYLPGTSPYLSFERFGSSFKNKRAREMLSSKQKLKDRGSPKKLFLSRDNLRISDFR